MRALNGVKLYFTVAPMFERERERETSASVVVSLSYAPFNICTTLDTAGRNECSQSRQERAALSASAHASPIRRKSTN